MTWLSKVKELSLNVCNVINTVDEKYESMCIRAEKKITGGSTLDDKVETVVVPAIEKVVSKGTSSASTVVPAVKKTVSRSIGLTKEICSLVIKPVSKEEATYVGCVAVCSITVLVLGMPLFGVLPMSTMSVVTGSLMFTGAGSAGIWRLRTMANKENK